MKDLRITQEGDLMIKDDDFVVGSSDWQHREHLLTMEKGAIKQFPQTGVGIFTFIESEDVAGLLREVSMQYSADGMKVSRVAYNNAQLIIDAQYNEAE